jgi:ribosomal-protein-alanine N-acetyltransferase
MFLEVRASNASAIALYEKRGFAEVGLRRNYYPTAKGSEDAILMALDLTVYE